MSKSRPLHGLGLVASLLEQAGVPRGEWMDPTLDIPGTPERVVRALAEQLSGYREGALEELMGAFKCFSRPEGETSGLVALGPIEFSTLCAHHLMPFWGEVFVGYMPDKLLVGASKIPRVIEYYSRMLQVQERLTGQIAEFIFREANAVAVTVRVVATHACMACRGVRQRSTKMVTTATRMVYDIEGTGYDRTLAEDFQRAIQAIK